jgi:WD40 repeat protein
MTQAVGCPDCGARLSGEQWSAGLCLSCLLQLGLSSEADPGGAGGRSVDLPTMSPARPPLQEGQILGDRYRIRVLLGRGGMGEVFRAFDLKLRVDVALKAVRPLLLADERALAGLRQEVRAAREIVSPNVCRVFDLVELDGRELVSMEYVDGVTLAEVLRERSPLDLQEARNVAAQFLAGLDAIHAAGLVHRDIKPENVMLTRSGRVVVMDFGITRAASESRVRTVAGTAGYMAPEQALGDAVDARADVFSAAVVLAELVAPTGARTQSAREAVWRGVHAEPPRLDETPWAAVLRKAVARARDQRHATAAALSRALDEVTQRTTGDESLRPYPGLAVFTERDAGFFVGRELEIEALWKKLRRPHLQALIGPSGAGKSSFLHAGLGPSAPPGWRVVFATPGNRPFAALAHALAPELTGDADAVARLIDFEQPGVAVDVVTRWRRRHDHALLVIDQFEELFTQSSDDVQGRFADLLARLALEADVHVLLSMRDDFLFRCQRFESLAAVFSEMTAIGPPTGAALRRALVQPALTCGYRFEDEAMADQMLAAVAGERGALPLAAFAMSRLWETRDRERGLLTRSAYESIGGVAGALAQHAEATLDAIGQDRVPIVRELFRNLVTAQGTRATLERGELLSVFDEGSRSAAATVLDALIDARLLTSYETESLDGDLAGRRRIEIVHESLLTGWPRLVRWQIQDQDGAQLRDQLRQAARLWEARGKPEDLLWTGTSFREYELWRERYAGTLSDAESTFARAMTARAARRRLQRRAGTAALMAASLIVAIGMSVLWRRSEAARAEADTAARRAEAQQLFALGQLELQRQPSVAVAYALASLERTDNPDVRTFVVRALSQGPTPVIVARTEAGWGGTELSFSKTGEWLSSLNVRTGAVRLWRKDGSHRQIPESGSPADYANGGFADDEGSFVLTVSDSVRFHRLPDVSDVNRVPGSFRWGFVRGASLVTGEPAPAAPNGRMRRWIRSYPVPNGTPVTTRGMLESLPGVAGSFTIDHTGEWMLSLFDGSLFEFSLRHLDRPPRLLVRADGNPINSFNVSLDGSRIYLQRRSTALMVVSRASGAVLAVPGVAPLEEAGSGRAISVDGRRMAIGLARDQVHVHDLETTPGVDPMIVRLVTRPQSVAIHPNGSWLAVQNSQTISLWPLEWRHARVLRPGTTRVGGLAVDPAGRWIAAGGPGIPVNVWSLSQQVPTGRTALDFDENANRTTAAPAPRPALGKMEASPRGDLIAAGTFSGLWLMPLSGRPERLAGFNSIVRAVAFDPSGRWLAAGGGIQGELVAPGESVVRVWDLETRAVRVLAADERRPIASVAFLPDGRLLTASAAGARVWDLTSGASTLLLSDLLAGALPSPDGRRLLMLRAGLRPGGAVGSVAIYDIDTGRTTPLPSHGSLVTTVAWHPSGEQVVTGSQDGTVRIGDADGSEPHLLFGHDAQVWDVVVDPQGRWVASGGDDGTMRLWPMPDGQPFHTLPHAALLDRLRSLTTYRVVRDAESSSGYHVDFEPFTGWKREPPRW